MYICKGKCGKISGRCWWSRYS